MKISQTIKNNNPKSSAFGTVHGFRAALLTWLLLGLTTSLWAATDTWTGGGTPDGNWTNVLNWGGTAPNLTGDNLIFSGSTQPFTTNNAPAVTSVGWILFNTSVPFTNFGTGLTISSGYTNAAQNNQWSTALILGASQSFDVAASTTNTITGAILGTGMAITKTSPGTLILTSGNSYSGGTTIGGGTLQLNAATAAGPATSALSIGANTLNVLQGNNYNYTYSGSGAINIMTTPTTTFADNTTQLGTTAGLSGFTGTIYVVPTNNPGTGSTKFADPGNLPTTVTINLATTNGEYFDNAASSSPSFVAGSPNQGPFYSGIGAICGRIRLNNNFTLSGPLLLNGNISMGVQGGSQLGTYAGAISDGGHGYGFMQIGGVATVALSGTNTYSGYTSVSNGTVKLNATGSISNSTVILMDNGASFDVTAISGGFWLNGSQAISGIGTVKGNVNVPSTGQIIPGGNCAVAPGGLGLGNVGVGIAGTLKFANGLSFNGGSPITFDVASSVAVTSDKITVTGAVTNNGNTTILLNYLSGFPHAGTYTLMTYASTNGAGTFVLGGANATNVLLNVGATALTLTVTNIYPLYPIVWHGDGTANNWDLTTANWLNAGVPTTYSAVATNAAVFDDTGSNTPAINLTISTAPGGVVMSNSVETYTFSGNGSLTGGASLSLNGAGTLIINNSNNFNGGTLISSGTLQVGTNGNFGVLSGAILDNSQLVYSHNNTDTVNSAISGTGGVTVSGTGTEIFNQAMSYTGGTTVTNGTLQLNVNSIVGTITNNNGTLNLALPGTGQIVFPNAIAGSGGIITATPVSSEAISFNGSLVKYSGTINVPPSPGNTSKVLLSGGVGFTATMTNSYTLNIANGGTCLIQTTVPTNMLVNVSGMGNGENLGAFRLDNNACYGTINLTGPAAIGCFQQYTATIYNGVNDTNGAGISQGYGLVIDGGHVVFNTVFPSYGGNTTISNGTLTLVNTTVTNSPEIDINSGATFDVSQISGFGIPFGLPGFRSTQTLGGIGTNGFVYGNITLNSGGSLAVTCSTNGTPSLLMTNASTLTFNDNPVKVTVGGSSLPAGTYPLVSVAADGSAVAGSVAASTLTLAGAGLIPGATGALSISNAILYLKVTAAPTPASFGGVSRLPDNNIQLTFSGSNGQGYSVHATNLLTAPLSTWPVIGTGTFGAGPATFSDLNATNYAHQFYIISEP